MHWSYCSLALAFNMEYHCRDKTTSWKHFIIYPMIFPILARLHHHIETNVLISISGFNNLLQAIKTCHTISQVLFIHLESPPYMDILCCIMYQSAELIETLAVMQYCQLRSIYMLHELNLFVVFSGRDMSWGQDKMADISQTTFSSGFSWMKIFDFDWYFTEFCSQGSN